MFIDSYPLPHTYTRSAVHTTSTQTTTSQHSYPHNSTAASTAPLVQIPIFEFERLKLGVEFGNTGYNSGSGGVGQNQQNHLSIKSTPTIPTTTILHPYTQSQEPAQDSNQMAMDYTYTHTPPVQTATSTESTGNASTQRPSHQASTPQYTSSVQSRLITKTTWLPLSSLIRPIAPVPLDTSKIASMVDTLSHCPAPSLGEQPHNTTTLPPVDVLYYKSPTTSREFYFAFGGCHRLKACEQAGKEMVECKVLKVTKGMLRGYLGGSLDRVLGEGE